MFSIACGDDDGMTDGGTDGDVDMTTDGAMDMATDMMTDPCDGISADRLCDTPGSTCASETQMITCAANAAGCRVRTEMDCAMAGATCETEGGTAMCVMVDACEGVTNCDTEGRECDGDGNLIVCAMDAMGCLVEETTDCTAVEEGVCDDTGAMPMCAAPADPCEGLEGACETEGTTCDATAVVTCAPNAFGRLAETSPECSDVLRGLCEISGDAAASLPPGDPR